MQKTKKTKWRPNCFGEPTQESDSCQDSCPFLDKCVDRFMDDIEKEHKKNWPIIWRKIKKYILNGRKI